MAYITTQEVAEIRKALKAEFGKKFKFSVARRDGGLAVTVAIMAGKCDFSAMWEGRAPQDYGYGYQNVNPYFINQENYPGNVTLFKKIDKIIKSAPANAEGGRAYFNDSDSQTDYFHTAFYYDIQIGKWDRPYVQTA
jgi:hypothetical protein